jgi:hypothetical protein
MAVLERTSARISPPLTESEWRVVLPVLEWQLEKADANENPIERAFNRDELLEQQDELQANFEVPTSPPILP